MTKEEKKMAKVELKAAIKLELKSKSSTERKKHKKFKKQMYRRELKEFRNFYLAGRPDPSFSLDEYKKPQQEQMETSPPANEASDEMM